MPEEAVQATLGWSHIIMVKPASLNPDVDEFTFGAVGIP